MRASISAVLAALALVLGGVAASPPATARPAEEAAAAPQRVVWNAAGLDGLDIRAADVDGTRAARLFEQEKGWADNLTLSPDGSLLAFAPYHGRSRPSLVVVPTAGGRARDLLAGHPRLAGVGAIGWSRDGRRLAFEGFVDEPSKGDYDPSYLYRVDADGTHLRRGPLLDAGRHNGTVFGDLVWTRDGVLYEARGVVSLIGRHGDRRVVLRRAFYARASGDGRWIVFSRLDRDHYFTQIWRARSDGTHATRLAAPEGYASDVPLDLSLDRTGAHVLATYVGPRGGGRAYVLDAVGDTPPARLTTTGHAVDVAWN